MRRLHHHLILTGITALMLVIAAFAGPVEDLIDRFSIVTAYLCLGLLCTGLVIGPVRAVHTGRPTTNNYLRRDVGIWAALTGLVHLVVGTVESMTPIYRQAYVTVADPWPSVLVRTELFVWGTIAGLIVGAVVLLLLLLSNDRALRLLGVRWWKRLHRTSYLAFVLTVLHGLAFQVLESRNAGLIAMVLAASLAVLTMQIKGASSVRENKRNQISQSRR